MVTDGGIRPSEIGPAFLFELPTPIDEGSLFKIIDSTLSIYNKYTLENPEKHEGNIRRSFDSGAFNWNLDRCGFGFDGEIPYRVLGIVLLDKFQNDKQSWMYKFHGQMINDIKLHYLCIFAFRNRSKVFYNQKEMEIIHGIIKKWIEYLNPNFVWGDIFSTLKQYESEDSRFRVWAYNYYSKSLIDILGLENMKRVVIEHRGWVVESVRDGQLLMGCPDPYQLSNKQKNNMAKALDLERKVNCIVTKKVQSIQTIKEEPPKGVVKL